MNASGYRAAILATGILAAGGFGLFHRVTSHHPVLLSLDSPAAETAPLPLPDPIPVESNAPGDSSRYGDAHPAPAPIFSHSDTLGTDLKGRPHRWRATVGEQPEQTAAVFVFLGTQCPISNGCLPRLMLLAEHSPAGSVRLFGVISDPHTTRADAVSHSQEYAIDFPVLFDADGSLRRKLGATHTPHAFVVDGSGVIRYSGAVDDQYADVSRRRRTPQHLWLQDAIAAVHAGQPCEPSRTKPVGCRLETPTGNAPAAEVTFNRHIAPIIFARCSGCHHEGAVAPFPLMKWEQVVAHAEQIGEVTARRIMPPWKPEPGFGHFRNVTRLTDDELSLIRKWIDTGKTPGHADDLPPAPEYSTGWKLGEPDLILTVPEAFDVPADGPDLYRYFVIPTGLTEDRLVSAIEYRPGSPQVVHHASFRYDASGAARELDAATPGPGYERFGDWGFPGGGTLGGWALGIEPQRFPPTMGRLLKAGSDFVIQTHYHPNGKPHRDRGQVGIYFAPDDARTQVIELVIANMNLEIPPEASQHVHRAEYRLPVDAVVHKITPHMHLLGRRITVTAETPHGHQIPLLKITDWDFNWQASYAYQSPIPLSAGTTIHVECIYDNSHRNPFNPTTPPRHVSWGAETTDEMGVCFLDVTTGDPETRRQLQYHNHLQLARQYELYLAPVGADEGDTDGD